MASAEFPSMAFWRAAEEFARAATTLQNAKPANDPFREFDPIYFLSAHSIELSLKAYLRWTGIPTNKLSAKPYGHDLQGLYAACLEAGLTIPPNADSTFTRFVSLLNGSNKEQGLRYYTLQEQHLPDPAWCAEGATMLVLLVIQQTRGQHPSGIRQPNTMRGQTFSRKPRR